MQPTRPPIEIIEQKLIPEMKRMNKEGERFDQEAVIARYEELIGWINHLENKGEE